MRPNYRLLQIFGATAGLIAAGPGAALADVTPADVWSNLQAVATATGGTVSADVSSGGGALTAANITLDYALPMGLGSIGADVGIVVLTDNGDGTVDMGGPEVQIMRVTFDIPGVGAGSVSTKFRIGDFTYTASGVPGDVTYAYSVGSYEIVFEDVALTGEIAEEVGEFDLNGTFRMTGMTGEYRITEGDLLEFSSDGNIGGGTFDFDYEVNLPEGETLRSTSTASLGAMTGKMAAALPSGGVSPLALARALRDGMSLSYSYVADGQTSDQETFLDGELVMAQRTSIGDIVGSVTLDATGLSGDGTASEYVLSFNQPLMFPVPVEVTVAGVEFDLAIPLLQDDDPQRAAMKMVAQGIEIDADLWAMFDPGAQLPRDPANLTFDLSGQVTMLADLLDFETLVEMDAKGEMPAQIHALDVAAINLSAVGAAAAVTGLFTFDNSDLITFDGLPAPDGSARIVLTGVDALLDRLVEMGLASSQDLMGPRMALGGFSRPGASPDERVIEIEIDGAAGTISANGQRLK